MKINSIMFHKRQNLKESDCLKLYLAGVDGIDDVKYVHVFWAKSEEDAKDQLVEKIGVDEYDTYALNTHLDEFLQHIKGHEKEVLQPLIDGDYSRFAKNTFRIAELKVFRFRECEVDLSPEKNIYLIVDNDEIKSIDDVFIISAKDEEEALDIVSDQIAEVEMYREGFREFVNYKTINCSLNEEFYKIDGEYIFDFDVDTDNNYAPHVINKYKDRLEEIDQLVEEEYEKNVWKFFGKNKDFAQQYLDYQRSDKEPNFSDEFYRYVFKQLCKTEKWINLVVKEIKKPNEMKVII